MQNVESRITFRSFLIGFLFAAVFAGVSVYFTDRGVLLTATQIPVLPYMLLFVTVLLINPVCRLLRFVRSFSTAEIMIIFMMGLVSSGISTFGLAAQLVPVVGNLFNRSWNNEQTEWNRHVVPFLNEEYFVAESGIQEAARDYSESFDRRREAREILNTASRYLTARERVAESETAWERAKARDDGSLTARMTIETNMRNLEVARANLQRTRDVWESLRKQKTGLAAPGDAIEIWRPKLEALEEETAAARDRLASLEEVAFDKVEIFRRGLPRHMRAYPGFVMLPEDTLGSYLARFRRVQQGRQVAVELRETIERLERDGPAALETITPRLQAVHQRLLSMSDATAVHADLEEKTASADRLREEISELETGIRELHRRRREATRDEIRVLEREINRAQRALRSLRRQREKVVRDRDYLHQQIVLLERAAELADEAGQLAAAAAAGTLPPDAGETMCDLLEGLPAIDGSLRRFLAGDVPWHDWIKPLMRWALIIALTYIILMTFNVLIFRQWAHNEKLIYPLAELPMCLVAEGAEDGRVPRVFRDGLFWAGFAVSGGFLGYNALVFSQMIPGLEAINFRNLWTPYLNDTPFEGLLRGREGGFARSQIFFTMIGLSFLIPKKVSFSLWFFSVLSMIQILALVALGYGQNEASFPHEWWYTLYFRTAQGGGALIVFASFVLFKCRHFLLCAFRPAVVKDLPDDERRELRISSLVFVLSSIGIVLALWLGMGANLLYTIATYFIIMVITVGLVRAVAEGGILGFQAWANPFHFIRTFFGMDKTWTAAPLYAPLMIYYSIMFLDIKTFIAPAMANSLKIRDDLRMRRGRFHAAIFAAIFIAAVVSVAMSVMMAYANGADTMQGWFYTNFPRDVFERIATISRTPPAASPGDAGWVIVGAVAMLALLYFRQTAFWLPHPIGMIMLVNPMMGAYWFSILLGWAAKSLVTKYGNKETYGRARTLFIGLIVGELFLVMVAMILTTALDIRIPIDLNRN